METDESYVGGKARSGLGVEDTERTRKAIAGVAGKRLTYNQPRSAHA